MGRKQFSTFAAALGGLVFLMVLLPWFSVSKEEMSDRGRDYGESTQDWVTEWMKDQTEGMSGTERLQWAKDELSEGHGWSGFSAGGLATWLFAILGAAACLLVVLGKQALVPVSERGILWIALLCFGVATLANLIAVFGAPSPKTAWAWISLLACAGAGGLCYLATNKPPTTVGAAATPESGTGTDAGTGTAAAGADPAPGSASEGGD